METNDTVTLQCRHCGQSNRFPVERALRDLTGVRCGSCKNGMLLVSGEPLTDIADDDLAHPWDREALEKLQAIPYADKLLSTVMGATIDKLARFNFLAGAVKVTDKQAPGLLKLYLKAAGRLDVDPPPLFMVQSPIVNAYTMGSGNPLVGVTSGLLDAMNEDEILGVLGHELTHVKLGHVLYRSLAILIANGALSVLDKVLGIGRMLVMPLQIALMRWYQMSELSADRGELITVGSLETAVRTHMMLAGGSNKYVEEMDVAAFIDQAHEAEALRDSDMLVWIMEMLDTTARTHPLPAWRVHHALKWARTDAFFKLLAGEYRPALGVSP